MRWLAVFNGRQPPNGASTEPWGVSWCTVDGQQGGAGGIKDTFCVQSISKIVSYAMVLETQGFDKVSAAVSMLVRARPIDSSSASCAPHTHARRTSTLAASRAAGRTTSCRSTSSICRTTRSSTRVQSGLRPC